MGEGPGRAGWRHPQIRSRLTRPAPITTTQWTLRSKRRRPLPRTAHRRERGTGPTNPRDDAVIPCMAQGATRLAWERVVAARARDRDESHGNRATLAARPCCARCGSRWRSFSTARHYHGHSTRIELETPVESLPWRTVSGPVGRVPCFAPRHSEGAEGQQCRRFGRTARTTSTTDQRNRRRVPGEWADPGAASRSGRFSNGARKGYARPCRESAGAEQLTARWRGIRGHDPYDRAGRRVVRVIVDGAMVYIIEVSGDMASPLMPGRSTTVWCSASPLAPDRQPRS